MPATAPARITDVDALRGFALLGILVVNSCAFGSVYYGTGLVDPAFTAPQDTAVRFLVTFLFEAKFYLLFSFLFGYSVTLQMRSAEQADEQLMPRMLRRQLGLWVIGLAHAVLLFHGDILTTYAVLGLALLGLRRRPEPRLLTLAGRLIIVTAAAWGLVGLLQLLNGEGLDTAAALATVRGAELDYRGSVATVISRNLRQLPETAVVIVLAQAPCALAMFLIGFVAGRRRLLERDQNRRPLETRLLRLGATVGLPGALFCAGTATFLVGSGWEVLGLAVGLASAPFLTGAYVAALLRIFQTRGGTKIAAVLAPAGRMALTNYLLQSLACAVLFTAYGFRLVGQVPPWAVAAITVALFSTQIALSAAWLRHFAYGPVEWLLRALTVGAWPTWRRRQPSVAV
ncbi:DUF418 domain-containing protein [Chelatococcus sp. SYSU_G07232]|uniref:DUF418 domain-containing protein n=1 Tax=Chelatococcus albus TaxID=3047466 RepID=A0ABT7AFC2_9HYPH|nr:DUF418 domain-containing protein [Chelatococcus sp. SYSU_G07232]MDJ1158060.1 DUF418 domain-containing protein [Chelatococcus sp. SYSU_G07232]